MAAICSTEQVRSVGASGRPELVERTEQLETLSRAYQGAQAGVGTAVMICAPAGMGKTSLVNAFLASLTEADGMDAPTVLWGGCDDLIAPRPFGPFRDMVRSHGLLPNELAVDPDLEELLANLVGVLDRPTRPTVMVVEDAQWADDESIDVLRYLARRLTALPALLIITARGDEVGDGHAIRGLLTGSSSSAPVRMDLHPLSADGVARLGSESELGVDYLYEVSGGNPLLVRQLLTADPTDAAGLARETLIARAAGLSTAGRAALHALAMLPNGASPTLARTLFADRADALHEAEATGLLASTTARIHFRHELARTAVIEAMSFGERLAVTDKVLAALTETGEDPTVLVHIARAAGDGPRATEFALDVLARSSEDDADHDDATVWVLARTALECTANLSVDRIAWLHTRAATAGRAINRHNEALHHADRAVQLLIKSFGAASDEPTGRSRLVVGRELALAWMTQADLQGDVGDHLRARTGLRNAMKLVEADPDGEEWVACNTRLAAAALISGELARSAELATRSIERAEASGWNGELVHALAVRGAAAGGPATEQGRNDLVRARELGAMHGPPQHHIAALLRLADGLFREAKTDEAERVVDEAVRCGQEHGLAHLCHRAQVLQAQILIHRGRTAAAEKLTSTLIDKTSDPAVVDCGAEATLARILVRRADEQAAELVERTWAAAVATGEIERLAFAGITRLEYLWVEGDAATLRQFARYLLGLGDRHRHHRLRAVALRFLYGLEGRTLDASLVDEEADGDGPFAGCPAPLAAALVGDHHVAADRWEAAGEPYEQALELIESTDAASAFQGLRLLDRIGATRIADLYRHRLRARGLQGVPRGPRKSTEGGVPVLTGRQLDVLKLLARGLTNAEIAGELYVARRTVDNHVSAILSRLGAKDRVHAVDEARARGLVNP